MNEILMALEALRAARAVLPALLQAIQALLGWIKAPTVAGGVDTLNALVGYAEEALGQVMGLTFHSDDPVANAIGQWQSAYRTVAERAAAAGLLVDSSAVHTAMDLASHKVGIDSPLDAITPADSAIPYSADPTGAAGGGA